MTRTRFVDHVHFALGVAGFAIVCSAAAALIVTRALGGFLLPALVGGALLALVLAAINRRTPPPVVSHDPFAGDTLATGLINYARVRVSGVGGLALVAFCAIVAREYALISTAVLAGAIGGAIGAVFLIQYRRVRMTRTRLR